MSRTATETRPRTPMNPAQRLQGTMAAAKLSFTWFGVRKSLNPEQRAEAADAFGAEGQFLSAGKKLLDTRDPCFKAVSTVRSQAVAYWRSVSLPFPEPGLRLIRQDRIDVFNEQMGVYQAELAAAVDALESRFDQLKAAARERLGRLFNAADYPESLTGLFAMSWEFPSVEPPNYLRELNPELYQQECDRVRSRFTEAVQLAEQAFLDEFARLVSHLTERLSGTEDGKPKVFRDSAVENLTEFFERFRDLNVRSNPQLDELVGQAQQVVRGVEPQQLRDSTAVRQDVATQLARVGSVLEGLLVDQPRRRILRGPRSLGAIPVMHVFISPVGTVHTVYDESLDLRELGPVSIRRASTVEPDHAGQWWADLGPVDGPRLGPFPLRSDALTAERAWLDAHWQPQP